MAPRDTTPRRPQNGQMIRDTRWARKLSIYELADRAGLSAPTISKVECEVRGIAFERLERIAKALDVPVTDLLREPYKTRVSALNGSDGDGSEAA